MMQATADRIEKQVRLQAPVERVWRAIADAKEFGAWFGERIEGPWTAGSSNSCTITADGDYKGFQFDKWVEAVEPPRRFAYRWHPGIPKAGDDFAAEPTTLVEFLLEPADGGTLLTVVESGFDAIPLSRRAEAYSGNTYGWEAQMEAIARYVDAG